MSFHASSMFKQPANNETVQMTRRYPNLPAKILRRDSEIVKKIINAGNNDKSDRDAVLRIYMKEHKNLSDERYWELMRTVWILTGTVENAGTFRQLMRSNRKQRFYFSTPEEAKRLREMPESFEIYRATNDENDGGLSWTISRQYVEHYQQAYQKKLIITRTVFRSEIFAFIERNNEEEIIIL